MAVRFGMASAVLLIGGVMAASPVWSQQPAKPLDTAKPMAPAMVGIKGRWRGSVRQVGMPKPYALNLQVTADGGTTDYPSLGCAGTLTRVGQSGNYTFYLETITKGGVAQGGRCINGSITLVISATGTLVWGWVGADQGTAIVASSTLLRQ